MPTLAGGIHASVILRRAVLFIDSLLVVERGT
jgi:hypothetical protein